MGAEAAHAHTERELRGLCGEPLRLTGEPAGRQARGGRASEREGRGGGGRARLSGPAGPWRESEKEGEGQGERGGEGWRDGDEIQRPAGPWRER